MHASRCALNIVMIQSRFAMYDVNIVVTITLHDVRCKHRNEQKPRKGFLHL